MRTECAIDRLDVSAYRIPTDRPESDGTLEWNATTLVVVEAHAGGVVSLGYTYADRASADLIRDTLASEVVGRDAFAVQGSWDAMRRSVRNLGARGVAAMAVSAVDAALWDLKARLLDLPLVDLLGAARDEIAVYGSGGFTSYDETELIAQLGGWVGEGFDKVKMKIGRDPAADRVRVAAVRKAIGEGPAIFVDANGGYDRKVALAQAEAFAPFDVRWFEEPVSSDDLDGLRLLRDRGPAGMEIAAGEYGYDPSYFRRMLEAGAVDVMQADASRCLGVTGFTLAAALCEARSMRLSAHCAPQLHAHLGCALTPVVHLEYFHDHARIEGMLFDGVLLPSAGVLRPDRTRAGFGITLKRADASRYRL